MPLNTCVSLLIASTACSGANSHCFRKRLNKDRSAVWLSNIGCPVSRIGVTLSEIPSGSCCEHLPHGCCCFPYTIECCHPLPSVLQEQQSELMVSTMFNCWKRGALHPVARARRQRSNSNAPWVQRMIAPIKPRGWSDMYPLSEDRQPQFLSIRRNKKDDHVIGPRSVDIFGVFMFRVVSTMRKNWVSKAVFTGGCAFQRNPAASYLP